MITESHVDPHVFVVFGGTGDLMRRKLLPSIFRLGEQDRMGPKYKVLAIAREKDISNEQYRERARTALEEFVPESKDAKQWCDSCLHYQTIGDASPADYKRIKEYIEQLESEYELPGNRSFYLALPPGVFVSTIEGLGESGLNRSDGWTRLVIEKPFGRDLESAIELNRIVHKHFDESQVYRIDHYLGKETVQNMMVFRFANPIFESVWNRDRVKDVQITVAESVGVGTRAGYYDQAGALRDMIQNHLTQLLTLTAMESPVSLKADSVRSEKVKVLQAIAPIREEDVVFGQYSAGHVRDETVKSYLHEDGVVPGSNTETFVALKLHIENWRWQGVPFYVRTGKRMKQRLTQITVNFKRPPVTLFEPFDSAKVSPNAIVLTLQPDEGFDLRFEVKSPNETALIQSKKLSFQYAEEFGRLPDGYETLLHDILTNDQTLFVRSDEVEHSWELYEPLLELDVNVYPYRAGGWGPSASDQLLERGDDAWTLS
ncbi:MAG: glucose-6-phosphate dehydrogenase [Rhodothermales bacterium]|nr:glucose-6-phosphate dehydrogenase [Rhodothermales bacterium]